MRLAPPLTVLLPFSPCAHARVQAASYRFPFRMPPTGKIHFPQYHAPTGPRMGRPQHCRYVYGYPNAHFREELSYDLLFKPRSSFAFPPVTITVPEEALRRAIHSGSYSRHLSPRAKLRARSRGAWECHWGNDRSTRCCSCHCHHGLRQQRPRRRPPAVAYLPPAAEWDTAWVLYSFPATHLYR